jgi:hypothetical protein
MAYVLSSSLFLTLTAARKTCIEIELTNRPFSIDATCQIIGEGDRPGAARRWPKLRSLILREP